MLDISVLADLNQQFLSGPSDQVVPVEIKRLPGLYLALHIKYLKDVDQFLLQFLGELEGQNVCVPTLALTS